MWRSWKSWVVGTQWLEHWWLKPVVLGSIPRQQLRFFHIFPLLFSRPLYVRKFQSILIFIYYCMHRIGPKSRSFIKSSRWGLHCKKHSCTLLFFVHCGTFHLTLIYKTKKISHMAVIFCTTWLMALPKLLLSLA